MIKQLLATMILTVTLILVGGQSNQAEAADYYVGTYKDGNDAYLMTETIRHTEAAPGGAYSGTYDCRVKAVKGSSVTYIDYHFYIGDDGWYYRNSQGFGGYMSEGVTPIANRIFDYMVKHH